MSNWLVAYLILLKNLLNLLCILGTKEIFSFFLNPWKIHLLAFSTGKNFILFFVQLGI